MISSAVKLATTEAVLRKRRVASRVSVTAESIT